MIERPSTAWTPLATVMCDWKRADASTILAEARACRPFLLMILTVAQWRKSDPVAHEIERAGAHVFAPRLDGLLDRLLQRHAAAHFDELDEAGEIDARQHLDLAAVGQGEREN